MNHTLSLVGLALLVYACGGVEPVGDGPSGVDKVSVEVEADSLRKAYFGDLHVHTAWSFDSYVFNVRTTPDDAYRFAKGEAIEHVGCGTDQWLGLLADWIKRQ